MGNFVAMPHSDEKKTQVYMQLLPPLRDEHPAQYVIDGVQLSFVNNGPVVDENIALKVFLPPIKGLEGNSGGVRVVGGGVNGSTSAQLLISKLGIGEKHSCRFAFQEVTNTIPTVTAWRQKYGAIRAWSKAYGDIDVRIYRISFGPRQAAPPGGPKPFFYPMTIRWN
jgi:hypothetical protein